jgi:CheY-like chemotaxis protein
MKPISPDTNRRTNTHEGDCDDVGDTAAASCPPNSKITASLRSTSNGHRPRLAIACPDGAIRDVLAPLFDSVGTIDVHEVTDGAKLDAMLVGGGPFDLIISHAALPGSRGLEVLTRARERGDETPFILVQSLHQNFVRITIGGGQHSIVSTRLVNLAAMLDLVRQILFERSAKSR